MYTWAVGNTVTIVGGGLSGCEAAWQLARRGVRVRLLEMKPVHRTPAHSVDQLGELVCSNSLGADRNTTTAGLLKAELRLAGSLIMQVAQTVFPALHLPDWTVTQLPMDWLLWSFMRIFI